MSPQTLGILVGGILPAIVLGLFGTMQKVSSKTGIGLGPFFTLVGVSIALCGAVLWLATGQSRTLTPAAAGSALLTGFLWFCGVSLIMLAIVRYDASISQLTPLYNLNSLVVAALGMLIFAEWRQVNPAQLFAGTLLAVLGAVLVARA